MKNVIGISSDSLSRAWQRTIRAKYQPQIEGRTHPDSVGKALITGDGGMNMAPALSPDGERIVYISQRELFTLDLYLADARTGEVIRKLTSSATNTHFDALRFMDAAGAWSPNSKQFAFVVIANGDNAVSIVNVNSGKVTRTITINEVDAIQHLAWSPDGDRLLLSGSIGGASDLFLYDMKMEKLEKITSGRFAEIQPSWGPEGEKIVFTTDRGSLSDLQTYDYSDMKIGILDLRTREITTISMGEQRGRS